MSYVYLTYFSNSYVSMTSLWFINILPTTPYLMPLWFLYISPTLPTPMSLCRLYDFYIFHLIFQLLCLYVASMIYIYYTYSYNSYVPISPQWFIYILPPPITPMSLCHLYDLYTLHLQYMYLCQSMVYICFSYS